MRLEPWGVCRLTSNVPWSRLNAWQKAVKATSANDRRKGRLFTFESEDCLDNARYVSEYAKAHPKATLEQLIAFAATYDQ